MRYSETPVRGSAIARRDFVKMGVAGEIVTALPAGLPAETKEKGVDRYQKDGAPKRLN
jgi:hypothetical protein